MTDANKKDFDLIKLKTTSHVCYFRLITQILKGIFYNFAHKG